MCDRQTCVVGDDVLVDCEDGLGVGLDPGHLLPAHPQQTHIQPNSQSSSKGGKMNQFLPYSLHGEVIVPYRWLLRKIRSPLIYKL